MPETTQKHWLQKLIDERDVTQVSLAEYIGITPVKLSRILSGERKVQPTEYPLIAEFFKIPIEDLLPYRAQVKITSNTLDEITTGVTDSIAVIINLLIKKNLTNRREMIELFTHQKIAYEKLPQKGSLLVVEEILDFLFDGEAA